MKYSADTYQMTQTEAGKIATRLQNYIFENSPKKGVQTALVTTVGLKPEKNADAIQNVIVLGDLFK